MPRPLTKEVLRYTITAELDVDPFDHSELDDWLDGINEYGRVVAKHVQLLTVDNDGR